MDLNEFQKDKEIDPSQLDVECVRQADCFFKWAEACIEAEADLDRAKLRKDVVEAKLEMDCRQTPTDFGISKPTEAAIKAAIRIHDDYSNAHNVMVEAKRQHKLLEVAVKSMEQKKRMLESLITLHGQQYFAGPSVPRDLVGDWKDHQDGVTSTVNSKQKERTRKRKK